MYSDTDFEADLQAALELSAREAAADLRRATGAYGLLNHRPSPDRNPVDMDVSG